MALSRVLRREIETCIVYGYGLGCYFDVEIAWYVIYVLILSESKSHADDPHLYVRLLHITQLRFLQLRPNEGLFFFFLTKN